VALSNFSRWPWFSMEYCRAYFSEARLRACRLTSALRIYAPQIHGPQAACFPDDAQDASINRQPPPQHAPQPGKALQPGFSGCPQAHEFIVATTGKATMPNQTKLLSILSSLSLLAGILMIVLGVPAFVVVEKNTSAFVILIAGFIAVLVGRLNLVEELSLGPLRTRLRASIDEANATLRQLRAVALGLAEASLTDLMAGNFFDNMSLRQRLDTHDVITSALLDLGLSQSEVQKASANWNKGIALTYWRAIRTSFPETLAPAIRLAYNALAKFDEWRAPTPDELEAFVEESNLETPEIAAWISDYRHFLRTNEIRRRDEFARQ
jgi:hypothetical protein